MGLKVTKSHLFILQIGKQAQRDLDLLNVTRLISVRGEAGIQEVPGRISLSRPPFYM